MMLSQDADENDVQLKSAVYLTVARIVEEEVNQRYKDVATTPTFIASLVELVFKQIVELGQDLELFANHAERSTIKPTDLYMVTRRNESLTDILKHCEQELKKH